MSVFPHLAPDWLATRDTLHKYSQILGAIRRLLTPPHRHWWHISLGPTPRGLSTGNIDLPTGRRLVVTEDLVDHAIRVECDGSEAATVEIGGGLSSRALGLEVLEACRAAGAELPNDFNSNADDEPRVYSPEAAATYLEALLATDSVFETARAGLGGEVGPVQLWPHHFDLSFEWFGTRTVIGDEGEAPSQIGYGFSTGDGSHPDAYYYATPWPFEDALTRTRLPEGARWQTEGWQGGLLPYSEVERGGDELLSAFLAHVHEVAAARLTADGLQPR